MVALDWTRPKDPPMSLGHASILANLVKHGIEVLEKSYSVNHANFQVDNVIDFVLNNSSKDTTDFGIGAFVWNEIHVQKIIKTLKHEGFQGGLFFLLL